jgi:hypothetical protein
LLAAEREDVQQLSRSVVNELERNVLAMLLAGDHPSLTVLREQFAVVEVEAREFSGVGFFTELRVPPSAPRLEGRPRLIIGDVHAEVSGLEHPVGFLLFVSDGALDMLECFIYDDQWPTHAPTLMRAYYVHTGERGEVVETPSRDLQSAFR